MEVVDVVLAVLHAYGPCHAPSDCNVFGNRFFSSFQSCS
jgi:hypothetical protein